MITPDTVHFEAFRGQPFVETVTVSIDGAVQDLTGWSAALVISDRPGGTALLTLTTTAATDNGSRLLSSAPTTGALAISIDSADIDALPAAPAISRFRQLSNYLQLTSPAGVSYVYSRGVFKVSEA